MIALNTAFPGASAERLRYERGKIRFSAAKGGGPVSMWWHFAIEAERATSVECVWERTDEVLGYGGLGAAVPVFDDGTRWRRVPARSCHFRLGRGEFRFRVPCRKGITQVAYCFPYGWDKLQAFRAEMVENGLVTARVIGKSEHGRPFELLEFGEGPRQVWVTARHHAGETPGAYVLEGLVREALGTPRLLQAATFHVAAAMDVDGVAEGLYGKDRGPRDFNRDYVSQPCRPEIAALRQAADAVGRVDLFLDLHGPAPGDCTFLVPLNETLGTVEDWDRAWEFGRQLEALAPSRCPVRVADLQRGALDWTAENSMQTSTSYFHRRFGALALCLETSYHRAWNHRLMSARDWVALGRALARTVAVQQGARQAPDVSAIEKPVSLIPRFDRWECVHLPVGVELRETPGSLELAGAGPEAGCWVMYQLPCAAGEARFSYRLEGEVAGMTVTAKGFDATDDLPTGAWESVDLDLETSRGWRSQSIPNETPVRLMFRVHGLQGMLELRVG